MSERIIIGLDVGGTNIKAVAVTPDGRVVAQQQVPTVYGAASQWKEDAKGVVQRLEEQIGRPADALGVCAPGVVAPDGKSVWWMLGKMEALMGLNWRSWLDRPRDVPVFNDAHAALMGEIGWGAARGKRNVVLLTLGTGVGGAIVCDGRLLRGHLGRAGHLGHLSVDFDGPPDLARTPGAIEHYIGNYSIQQRTGGRFNDTRALVAAYEAGDPLASETWLRSVKALAAHVVGLINAVDPEVMIIGGGIAHAGDALFKPLAAYLDEFEWRPFDRRVAIVRPRLGSDAGAMGAAYGAWLELDQSNTKTSK